MDHSWLRLGDGDSDGDGDWFDNFKHLIIYTYIYIMFFLERPGLCDNKSRALLTYEPWLQAVVLAIARLGATTELR